MTAETHTPPEWSQDKTDLRRVVRSYDNDELAVCDDAGIAKYITKACNAYPVLVETLKSVQTLLDHIHPDIEIRKSFNAVMHQVDEALEMAGVK